MSEKFTEPSSKGGQTEVSEDVHTDTQTNTSKQQERQNNKNLLW